MNQTQTEVLTKLKVLEEKHEKISKVLDDKVVSSNFVEEDWSNEGMNIYYTKNTKDVNEMVVDCGAPKTLIGEECLKEYFHVQNLSKEDCLITMPLMLLSCIKSSN